MAPMCPRSLAHHADGLLVVHTEELQLLSMLTTGEVPLARFFPASSLKEGLAEVPQGQVGWGALLGGPPSADGTGTGATTIPEALQAGSAEAVAARQQDRILEDVAAHGTRQVIF